jgi:hypothetical protein
MAMSFQPPVLGALRRTELPAWNWVYALSPLRMMVTSFGAFSFACEVTVRGPVRT